MSAEAIVSRLAKVKGRNGAWTACCPAHDDKGPSLAIREQDGKVLLHCFAGCTPDAVLGALGLDMTELFPPRPAWEDRSKPQPKVKFFASDLLRVIALEASIVSIAARDMAKGKTLPQADLDRLQLAYSRINDAMELSQ